MAKRRTALTFAGALASAGLTGTATALNDGDEEITAGDVELDDEIASLLLNGDAKEAESLLRQHDIRYDISRSEVDNGSDVGLQGRYSESASELGCSLVNIEDDLWLASGWASLSGPVPRLRDAYLVDDACAIVFDSSEWSSPEPTEKGVTLNDPAHHQPKYHDFNPNYGPSATVEYDYNEYYDTTIGMQTELIRRNKVSESPSRSSTSILTPSQTIFSAA
ncbi:hypothetical protein [Halovivax sp.]|uniref:hypothetical protein n=1 Tax=Halovivax sp. TaxID=1935978 RepID=UPI0025BC0A8F|nr:hypothetical protein [Halovivax sp.]